jgi:protein-disulfide isomerase
MVVKAHWILAWRGSRVKGLCLALLLGVWSLALVGASCDKKSSATPNHVETPAGDTPSDPKESAAAKPVVENLPGMDLKDLDDKLKARFYVLVDKLQSPCGKAHSLRTSLKTDPACRRATFAGRYVAFLLTVELSNEEITELYKNRYGQTQIHKFDLADSPYEGIPTAPVVLVEFFDYACPHCRMFRSVLEDVGREYPSDVVVYFKHFPLGGHKDSIPAAMAAIAAQKQGKFREMHIKLFEGQDHSQEALVGYAKAIGLDLKKFEADMNDPAVRAKVTRDRAEGDKVGLQGTPALYINGRTYSDTPMAPELLVGWIKEELAVNR